MQTRAVIAGSIRMKDLSSPASSDVHAELARMNAINTGTFDMGKVVFLYRSLAYRNAAADMLRKARKLPRGRSEAPPAVTRRRCAISRKRKPGSKDASPMNRGRCYG